jgi:hypothetical protein
MRNRWRHIPPRLPDWYRRHVDSMIQEAKAKRESNDFVADRQENVDLPGNDDDNRPTWRPYTDYLLRLADERDKQRLPRERAA